MTCEFHKQPDRDCKPCLLDLVEDQGKIIKALMDRSEDLYEYKPELNPILKLIEEKNPLTLKQADYV